MTLTPLALENAAVLRRLARPDAAGLTFTALAADLARDPSNLRKTLHRLETEAMVRRVGDGAWSPEPAALAALDRLDGMDSPVPGSAAVPVSAADQARWPLGRLTPDPAQPRKRFDPGELVDLARAIAHAGDVLVPLLVTPADASGARTIRAGERRWRACVLLAAGAVEGCTLPPALDRGLGGGLPIREVGGAPDPDAPPAPEMDASGVSAYQADAAWYALTENGNRSPLNAIEDGEALLTLSTARGWSARETAHQLGRVGKITGAPGAGSDGVKTVQERIKVARKATGADKRRFLTDPDFTWKDLLATVQAPKAEGASAAATEEESAPQRDGRFVTLTPAVVYDLDAMGWGLKGLSAHITLGRDPDGGWRYGYSFQYSKGGMSGGLGYTPGGAVAGVETRAQAFAGAANTLRPGADRMKGPSDLAGGARLLQWLNALGDGTADPADIPPRKPSIWDAQPALIRAGEGGASPPRTPHPDRQAPAGDEDPDAPAQFPDHLRRLAGPPVADDAAPLSPAPNAPLAGSATGPETGDFPPAGAEGATVLQDAARVLVAVDRALANTPVVAFAQLMDIAGLGGALRTHPLHAGGVFNASGVAVLTVDADGDLPDDLAVARARLVAAALNAANGAGSALALGTPPAEEDISPAARLERAIDRHRDWMCWNYEKLVAVPEAEDRYADLCEAANAVKSERRRPANVSAAETGADQLAAPVPDGAA